MDTQTHMHVDAMDKCKNQVHAWLNNGNLTRKFSNKSHTKLRKQNNAFKTLT